MASIFRTSKNSTHKSKCFSLGKPEAESETSFEDELSLKNLFVDEMNIIESINRGSFMGGKTKRAMLSERSEVGSRDVSVSYGAMS